MTTSYQILRDHGLKATAQRQSILAFIMGQDRPVAAEAIHEALEVHDPDLCLSTVYRNLNLFVAKNLLTRVSVADDRSYFGVAQEGHQHHLVCLGCHQVIDLDDCPVHEFEEGLMKDTKYRITQHQLTFYGYCPKCGDDHKQ